MKFRVLRNNEPDSFNGNITACRIGFQVGKYRAWLTFDSKIASGMVQQRKCAQFTLNADSQKPSEPLTKYLANNPFPICSQ